MAPVAQSSLQALREPILTILRQSDLQSISAKKVRSALAETPEPKQPSQKLLVRLQVFLEDKEQKRAVDEVIKECFDIINSGGATSTPAAAPAASSGNGFTNGYNNGSAPSSGAGGTPRLALPGLGGVPGSHATPSYTPPAAAAAAAAPKSGSSAATSGQKRRKNEDIISDDEEDADEATIRRKAKSSSKPVKKRKSAGASAGGAEKPPNPNNPFNKPVILSDDMSKICGEREMPRYMITKKLWAYIKERNLQNPANRRQILCDATLQHLFKKTQVDSFEMAKLISAHVTKKDTS